MYIRKSEDERLTYIHKPKKKRITKKFAGKIEAWKCVVNLLAQLIPFNRLFDRIIVLFL